MRATTKDLRFHAGALLDTVTRGEEVTITYRGSVRARLVPAGREGSGGKSEAFGIWSDRTDMDDPAECVRRSRRGRFQ